MSDDIGWWPEMGPDPEFDALCNANDAHRKSTSLDHSDEIEMLMRALRGDLSAYSPAGIQTMRLRLQFLHEELLRKREAA